jgi:hypothetical protein
MTAMPDINAIAGLVAAPPGVVTSAGLWNLRHSVLSVLDGRPGTAGLLSEQ